MAFEWISNRCFQAVHRKNLVYNTCWEDPRLDRYALDVDQNSHLLTITSAGCNVLDYLLDDPASVNAVDVNPLQNALLGLKIAAIQSLDFDDFFKIFGRGSHDRFGDIYRKTLRPALEQRWRPFWDQRINFFDGSHPRRPSFYFRGTSGWFAYQINRYLRRHPELRLAVNELLDARNVEEQRIIFEHRRVEQLLWRKPLMWTLRRDTTMALLGVPRSQRRQIETSFPEGLGGFVRERIHRVFQNLPLSDNYFWRVYLTGQYTAECCPEYLREENFQHLKDRVDRVTIHTDTLENVLKESRVKRRDPINRLILLDHMDWMVDKRRDLLQREWQAIVNHASSECRVLWRSAAPEVEFVNPIPVYLDGKPTHVGDRLSYHDDLANRLHAVDRVQTYGSFQIADLRGTAV